MITPDRGIKSFQVINGFTNFSIPEKTKPVTIEDKYIKLIREATGKSVEIFSNRVFNTSFWSTHDDFCRGTFCHFVENIKEAENFWIGCLNFKVQKSGVGWSFLIFMSPVNEWKAKLVLILDTSRAQNTTCLLNTNGYRCISFISSNLMTDRESFLSKANCKSTGIMKEVINNRKLDLEIFSGPSGAMIELFQIES